MHLTLAKPRPGIGYIRRDTRDDQVAQDEIRTASNKLNMASKLKHTIYNIDIGACVHPDQPDLGPGRQRRTVVVSGDHEIAIDYTSDDIAAIDGYIRNRIGNGIIRRTCRQRQRQREQNEDGIDFDHDQERNA